MFGIIDQHRDRVDREHLLPTVDWRRTSNSLDRPSP